MEQNTTKFYQGIPIIPVTEIVFQSLIDKRTFLIIGSLVQFDHLIKGSTCIYQVENCGIYFGID